jgi:hypothetical protein
MCAVSMITDHFRDKWPVYTPLPVEWPTSQPFTPTVMPQFIPTYTITLEQWLEYQELKRKAEEYDARTSQPDCVKPDVEVWEAAVKKFVQDGELPE